MHTQTQTLGEVIGRVGVDVHDYLDRSDVVPVLDGLQRQGDVIVVPTSTVPSPGAEPIPAEGVPAVRGENGGNTHLLLGEGLWRPVESTDPRNLIIGELQVAQGETAWIAHPEHGYIGIGPGVYTVKRKREQGDEIRRIAD